MNIFKHDPGDWWAECLVYEEWVSTLNQSRRDAVRTFGRHLQNDHTSANGGDA